MQYYCAWSVLARYSNYIKFNYRFDEHSSIHCGANLLNFICARYCQYWSKFDKIIDKIIAKLQGHALFIRSVTMQLKYVSAGIR